MERYKVTGMSCAACQVRVEKAVNAVEGVQSCAVNLLTNSMTVEGTASSEKIIAAVEAAGYGANSMTSGTTEASYKAKGSYSFSKEMIEDNAVPHMRKRLLASIIFLLLLMYVSMGHMMWNWPLPNFLAGNHVAMGLYQLLLSGIILIINQKFFVSGFKGLLHRAPNMDTLVALGAAASYLYSVAALFGMTDAVLKNDSERVMYFMEQFYFESAAMILTLITVGKMLEAMSKGKTTNALKALMELAPKTAVVLVNGVETTVPVETVKVGDIFVVKPGDNIPVDGIVREGASAVNEAALTGESIPVEKVVNERVSAATINTSGYMLCEATEVGEDTTLAGIIRMVSDAAATKAPIAKIADKVSGVFVPVVMGIAAVTFIVWLVVGESVGFAIARAVSVLVISCPCALGLATPVAIMVGNGVGARTGILFKNAVSLEQAGKTQIVALDKTGTITTGHMQVTDVVVMPDFSKEELLETAYILEARSEHPIARAVTEYVRVKNSQDTSARTDDSTGKCSISKCSVSKGSISECCYDLGDNIYSEKFKLTDFEVLAGYGLRAKIGDYTIAGGSLDYISGIIGGLSDAVRHTIDELSESGKTPVLFTKAERLLGIVAVADTIKPDSNEAITELKNLGLHVVMLTGDNEITAKAIARQAGVDEVVASVKPDGKEAVIRTLMKYGKVAMVGDGINDAPALTAADLGIAIGAGTDIAIDAADIVVMKNSIRDVAAAIRISRRTLRNIHENLFWAFFYNCLGIPLAAGCYIAVLGWSLNPMFGAAAMGLSSFCVVSNALRLNLIKPYDKKRDKRIKAAVNGNILEKTAVIENNTEIEKTAEIENDIEIEKTAVIENNTVIEKTVAIVNNTEIDNTRVINVEEREEIKAMKIEVKGMMCAHCEAHVKKALEAIEGIESAAASHTDNTVNISISKEIDEAVIKAAVEDAGYEYCGII